MFNVKSYDAKGELYRTYTTIDVITQEHGKFVLHSRNNGYTTLSIQEVKLEVET